VHRLVDFDVLEEIVMAVEGFAAAWVGYLSTRGRKGGQRGKEKELRIE
jgi:hypothetical protein